MCSECYGSLTATLACSRVTFFRNRRIFCFLKFVRSSTRRDFAPAPHSALGCGGVGCSRHADAAGGQVEPVVDLGEDARQPPVVLEGRLGVVESEGAQAT